MIGQDGLWLTEGPEDLAGFPWPAGSEWKTTKAWWEPIVRGDSTDWVANAATRVLLLRAGEAVLPVTVDAPAEGQSYVVSPWAQYVAYAGWEVARLPTSWQRWGGRLAIGALRPVLGQSRMDRVVQVNNALLSTNLWPGGLASWAGRIRDLVRERWPDRAVIFRSLDARARPELVSALREAGFRMIFSRIVTYQDPTVEGFWRNRQLRQDRQRGQREGWQFQTLGPSDVAMAPLLRRFYRALYLEKYAPLNPDFTGHFFEMALRTGGLHLELLRDRSGEPAGCWGWWSRDGVMTQPVFGYDPAGSWGAKPYAALSLRVLEVGAQHGLWVNASGGAGHFKQQRGGKATVEWHAVDDRHLPWSDRLPWDVLEKVAGPPVQDWMRRSGL